MMSHQFVVNLLSDTFTEEFRAFLGPSAYLIAPNNATTSLRQKASEVRASGKALFVDNGNFSFMGRLKRRFSEASREICAAISKEEQRTGIKIRPGMATTAITQSCDKLATEVRQAIQETGQSDQTIARQQFELCPTYMIGAEDIFMSLMLGLNIEPSYLSLSRDAYRAQNEEVVRRAYCQAQRLPDMYNTCVYPVASAVSYDTAYDAGAVFADAGLHRIAIGFGAYMADRNYTDYMIVHNRCYALPNPVPNQYLRSILVARGFIDGYQQQCGIRPEALHLLGLGAPIMIVLASLALFGIPMLTFDAMSPIKDVVISNKLYIAKPAPLKVDIIRIASRIVSGELSAWDCPCPFCQAFMHVYPLNYAAARAWARTNGTSEVTAADLSAHSPLSDALPLFNKCSGPIRRLSRLALIGHNHWVLNEIMTSLNKAAVDDASLQTLVQNLVAVYQTKTNSAQYADAIRIAYGIASKPINDVVYVT
jgi:hypothetical protein